MKYYQDTISAISTPIGVGGISVIRISGADSVKVVDEIFQSKRSLQEIPSHKAVFGKIFYEGKIIDEVVVTQFIGPQSYTGEDVVEISCHGSIFITNQILKILLLKTRLANPGEFTQRAFFNNKIGLTQAEAVGDMLNAKTRFSHLSALSQYEGNLRKRIKSVLEKITSIRIQLELEIDFQEQGLAELDDEKISEKLQQILEELTKLAASGEEGMILREGLKISLVGAPNVGKSSIFNKLLESERAIVTPHPGTTRDYLEEEISLRGYLIRIFDTAGIRSTSNQLEKIGIDRSYDVIKKSNKILFIIDGNENVSEFSKLTQMINPARIIKVLNKADLRKQPEIDKYREKGFIPCSIELADGLEELKDRILAEIEITEEELENGMLTNSRQIAAVNKARNSIEKAVFSFKNELGPEFTVFDLKETSSYLEEIIGKVTSDDILNSIFENFCIGK